MDPSREARRVAPRSPPVRAAAAEVAGSGSSSSTLRRTPAGSSPGVQRASSIAWGAGFGIAERDSEQEARRKLAGTLLLLGDGLLEMLPLVFEFLGVADPEHPAPSIDPEQARAPRRSPDRSSENHQSAPPSAPARSGVAPLVAGTPSSGAASRVRFVGLRPRRRARRIHGRVKPRASSVAVRCLQARTRRRAP